MLPPVSKRQGAPRVKGEEGMGIRVYRGGTIRYLQAIPPFRLMVYVVECRHDQEGKRELQGRIEGRVLLHIPFD